MTPESLNSSLLVNGSIKQVPSEISLHATIKEPVSKQRIGKHNNRGIVRNGGFYLVRAKWLY
jgi:hypothetical protein